MAQVVKWLKSSIKVSRYQGLEWLSKRGGGIKVSRSQGLRVVRATCDSNDRDLLETFY